MAAAEVTSIPRVLGLAGGVQSWLTGAGGLLQVFRDDPQLRNFLDAPFAFRIEAGQTRLLSRFAHITQAVPDPLVGVQFVIQDARAALAIAVNGPPMKRLCRPMPTTCASMATGAMPWSAEPAAFVRDRRASARPCIAADQPRALRHRGCHRMAAAGWRRCLTAAAPQRDRVGAGIVATGSDLAISEPQRERGREQER